MVKKSEGQSTFGIGLIHSNSKLMLFRPIKSNFVVETVQGLIWSSAMAHGYIQGRFNPPFFAIFFFNLLGVFKKHFKPSPSKLFGYAPARHQYYTREAINCDNCRRIMKHDYLLDLSRRISDFSK